MNEEKEFFPFIFFMDLIANAFLFISIKKLQINPLVEKIYELK